MYMYKLCTSCIKCIKCIKYIFLKYMYQKPRHLSIKKLYYHFLQTFKNSNH